MTDKKEEILKKYWHDEEEYYSGFYYDEKETEYSLKSELEDLFHKSGLQYVISEDECYDSCGYSCYMISVAWIESDGKLYMENILVEVF